STIGRPKAMVLPDPVGAFASTSRPARASGRTRAWIRKGSTMPRAASVCSTAALTPSAWKLFNCLFDSYSVLVVRDHTTRNHARRNERLKSHGTTQCRPWAQRSTLFGMHGFGRRGSGELLALERPYGGAQRRLAKEPGQGEREDGDGGGDDE